MNPQNTPFKEAPFVHTLTDEAWRDWYAGQALVGYVGGRDWSITSQIVPQMAEVSFDIADAMMAERAKRRMK